MADATDTVAERELTLLERRVNGFWRQLLRTRSARYAAEAVRRGLP